MKTPLRHLLSTAAVLVVTATFSLPTLAQDVRREDMVRFFQMDKVDMNKDGMVSKKEFMDMMGKSWDMHMADVAKTDKMGAMKAPSSKMSKDNMTLEQYREFAKMFNLDVGS